MKNKIKFFVVLCVLFLGFNGIARSEEEQCATLEVTCVGGGGGGISICWTNDQDIDEAIDEAIDVMCP